MKVADLLERRSISPKRLVEPGPSEADIAAIIEAACAAPDHRRLKPWRFILIRNEARDALANSFEAAAFETHVSLSPEQIERAREKAFNGACLIAVIARLRQDLRDVPLHEQWVSVGAATQNMLLAAHALGFGAMLVSGDKVATRALCQGLGLRDGEQLLGFVALGSIVKAAKPSVRPKADELLSAWPANKDPLESETLEAEASG